MRAGKREINIFSLSLLDILCGALGAFCFLFLVLFPYWRPGDPNAATKAGVDISEQALAELKRLAAEFERQCPRGQCPPEFSAQVRQRMAELEARLKQTQGEINKLLNLASQRDREIDRLKREVQQSKDKASELDMRNPVLVLIEWDSSQQDVDVYLEAQQGGAGGQQAPRMDPSKTQGPYYTGDRNLACGRAGCEIWMKRDMPAGNRYKLYYKFRSAGGASGAARVSGYFAGLNNSSVLPMATMTQPGSATLVGEFQMQAGTILKFTPAPEYAAVWAEIEARRARGK